MVVQQLFQLKKNHLIKKNYFNYQILILVQILLAAP